MNVEQTGLSQSEDARGAVGFIPARAGLGPVEWVVTEGLTGYEAAVAEMEARVALIADGLAPERVWLVEHPPLYTAGTSAKDEDLIAPERFPVHRSGRGGQFTYHGPGQRVAYVMLDLKRRDPDLRRFVAALEAWLIGTLDAFNVAASGARTASASGYAGPTSRQRRSESARTRSPRSASASGAGSRSTASR
jgi:lipoate-protein ligase B